MQRLDVFNKKSGTILIFSLWLLGTLTVFALILGQTVRQRATLVSRLEQRFKLHLIAQAGIKKALALLNQGMRESQLFDTARIKADYHNNEGQWGRNRIAEGAFEVSYRLSLDQKAAASEKFYGFRDEESKININKVGFDILKNLIQNVLGWDGKEAQLLAHAVRDWREFGESEAAGFYSDDYYDNLKYPYPQKKSNFELLEELLLVKMMTKDIYDKLQPYITVYGDGKVNVNTAPRLVLLSLGFSADLVKKILSARRGQDGKEATKDDFIFQHSYDFFSDLSRFFELDDEDISQINDLNAKGLWGTNSSVYRIESIATLSSGSSSKLITCVFNAQENKMKHWKEEYRALP